MLVDGEKHTSERLDGGEQVVDYKLDAGTVDLRQHVNDDDAVEGAEGMIAGKYHPVVRARRRQIGTVADGICHLKMRQHRTAEIGIAPWARFGKEPVEAVLADEALGCPDQPAGKARVELRGAAAYHCIEVDFFHEYKINTSRPNLPKSGSKICALCNLLIPLQSTKAKYDR